MHPYTKEYFEGGGLSNYKGYTDEPRFKEWAEEIVKLFNPKTVLDVGCAKGYLVKHLREMGVEAWGCDISEYAISEADPEVKPYLFLWDLTKPIPQITNPYDLVTSHDVLEHIPEADVPHVCWRLSNMGIDQYHVITCTEYDFHGDQTHITMKPEAWWQAKFPKVIVRAAGPKETLCS